jgi:hypothetical protein
MSEEDAKLKSEKCICESRARDEKEKKKIQ